MHWTLKLFDYTVYDIEKWTFQTGTDLQTAIVDW